MPPPLSPTTRIPAANTLLSHSFPLANVHCDVLAAATRYRDVNADTFLIRAPFSRAEPKQGFFNRKKRRYFGSDIRAVKEISGEICRSSYANRSEEHTSELQSLMRIS